MKCKKQYACLHTHTTAFGLMGADTLTGSLSSLSGPLASWSVCVHACLCLWISALFFACVCVWMCMCDPSGGSRQAPREFFNPLTESDSFTLKWESGKASLWTVCFRSIEKLQLHRPLSHTSACTRTHTLTQSHIRYMGICSAAGHTVGFPNCWTVMPSLRVSILYV